MYCLKYVSLNPTPSPIGRKGTAGGRKVTPMSACQPLADTCEIVSGCAPSACSCDSLRTWANPSAGGSRQSEDEGPISTRTPSRGAFQAIRETDSDLASRCYHGMLVILPVQAKRAGAGGKSAGKTKNAEGGKQRSCFRESPERFPVSIATSAAPPSHVL